MTICSIVVYVVITRIIKIKQEIQEQFMEQSNLWVEDSLHDILGLSDDKTVQYLTSMAS